MQLVQVAEAVELVSLSFAAKLISNASLQRNLNDMSHRSGDRARADKQKKRKRVIRAHRAVLRQHAIETRGQAEPDKKSGATQITEPPPIETAPDSGNVELTSAAS